MSMRRTVVAPLAALLAAACAPQNAEITNGEYIAFLSDGTSLSLQKETIVPADYDNTYNIDCRDLNGDGIFDREDREDPLRLEEPLGGICGKAWADPADPASDPFYETWITQAGFRVVQEQMEPWRGEAIITAEGDLQIGFHHRVPGGADTRFIIALNPNFQPTRCAEEGGNVIAENIDGEWVANWSSSLDYIASLEDEQFEPYAHLEPYLDGGQIWFLNAFGYQINPSATDELWTLPDEWQSGSTQGKLVEEVMFLRSPRFGDPRAYSQFESSEVFGISVTENDIWYCDMEPGADPTEDTCMMNQQERIRTVAEDTRKHFVDFMTPEGADEPLFTFAPIPHDNMWRVPDGREAGLDGWGELHYNYIVFSGDSELEAGGSARGAFGLLLDASDSATRVFVKGEFEIPKIRKDRWTTDDLLESKLEENEVTLCNDEGRDLDD
jgi:hypothetical protein